jgi:hypothetical protein
LSSRHSGDISVELASEGSTTGSQTADIDAASCSAQETPAMPKAPPSAGRWWAPSSWCRSRTLTATVLAVVPVLAVGAAVLLHRRR